MPIPTSSAPAVRPTWQHQMPTPCAMYSATHCTQDQNLTHQLKTANNATAVSRHLEATYPLLNTSVGVPISTTCVTHATASTLHVLNIHGALKSLEPRFCKHPRGQLLLMILLYSHQISKPPGVLDGVLISGVV